MCVIPSRWRTPGVSRWRTPGSQEEDPRQPGGGPPSGTHPSSLCLCLSVRSPHPSSLFPMPLCPLSSSRFPLPLTLCPLSSSMRPLPRTLCPFLVRISYALGLSVCSPQPYLLCPRLSARYSSCSLCSLMCSVPLRVRSALRSRISAPGASVPGLRQEVQARILRAPLSPGVHRRG
jgi:hypothetical protein